MSNPNSALDKANALARTINDTIWRTFDEIALDEHFGAVEDGAHAIMDDTGIYVHIRGTGQIVRYNADGSLTVADEETNDNAVTGSAEEIVRTVARDVMDIILNDTLQLDE